MGAVKEAVSKGTNATKGVDGEGQKEDFAVGEGLRDVGFVGNNASVGAGAGDANEFVEFSGSVQRSSG